jgi:polysaccharide biosynthesis/export protein
MIRLMKKTRISAIHFGLLLAILFILNSCYTPRDTVLLQDSKSLPNYDQVDFLDYKISPNDEIMFRLMTSDEDFSNLVGSSKASMGSTLNFSYRVYNDSTVDLPYLNPIKVGGLTLVQAEAEIKKKYSEIVTDAEIKLTLSNKTYTVIGDAAPGIYQIYKDKLTIFQALAQSGEIQLSGDRKHIKIIRQTSSKPEILEFDIRPKSIINSKYYYVYPNDIIYVQHAPASFYKVNNYSTFLGLISSSISLFITAFYFNKVK